MKLPALTIAASSSRYTSLKTLKMNWKRNLKREGISQSEQIDAIFDSKDAVQLARICNIALTYATTGAMHDIITHCYNEYTGKTVNTATDGRVRAFISYLKDWRNAKILNEFLSELDLHMEQNFSVSALLQQIAKLERENRELRVYIKKIEQQLKTKKT